ncbi:MAG: hypothetical protein RIR62_780 [Pseudomonadota bacterium]
MTHFATDHGLAIENTGNHSSAPSVAPSSVARSSGAGAAALAELRFQSGRRALTVPFWLRNSARSNFGLGVEKPIGSLSSDRRQRGRCGIAGPCRTGSGSIGRKPRQSKAGPSQTCAAGTLAPTLHRNGDKGQRHAPLPPDRDRKKGAPPAGDAPRCPAGSGPDQLTVCSARPSIAGALPARAISIRRGFSASGVSRTRSMCSIPCSWVAPVTRT